MPQSFVCVYCHLVFGTRNRARFLQGEAGPRVHQYIAGIIKANGCMPVIVNGGEDHVHVVLGLGKEVSASQIVRLIKAGTSRWVHDTFPQLGDFAWQNGYGMFSVSVNGLDQVVRYVAGQADHHREPTFAEECRAFLNKHGLKCDERYMWE